MFGGRHRPSPDFSSLCDFVRFPTPQSPRAALTGLISAPLEMSPSKLRRQIAWEAARLMYQRQETEYYRAKLKAARMLGHGWIKPQDLPSNVEIRDQIQTFARLIEGDARTAKLREMRVE